MALSIAYVWLKENLYDKEYVETHATGFEEWTKYVLGESDGQPKTPEWAAEETGLKASEIKALAREWAKNKTMLAAGGLGGWGGACRSPIGMDWARLMIALITMQGLGKPGINMWSTTQGVPVDADFFFPGYADGGISGDCENSAAGAHFVYRMFDGVTSRPTSSTLNTAAGQHIHVSEFLVPSWTASSYIGTAKALSALLLSISSMNINILQTDIQELRCTTSTAVRHIGTMGATNRYAKMYSSKNLPFVVSQSIWFEGEVPFADIILPACTNFERWDIGEPCSNSGYNPDSHTQFNHRMIVMQKKCIEPLGESKSDYEIFRLISERLGLATLSQRARTISVGLNRCITRLICLQR